MTGVLLRRGQFGQRKTETQGRRPCKERGRDWHVAATIQVTPRTAGNQQKLRRGKKMFFPRPFRGNMALPAH